MKNKQAKVYYLTGNDLLKEGAFLKAISSYKNAILVNPKHFEALCNLGVCYKNLGLLKEAEHALIKAMGLNPNSSVVYNNLGNVYSHMNKLEDAKKFYIKALQLNPNYESALRNLTQLYHLTGEEKKAIKSRMILEKMKR